MLPIVPVKNANGMVLADDITWAFETLQPRAEAVNLLTLDDQELLAYARDLQLELEAMRVLLHETLSALARANAQGLRYQKRVRELITELRISRESVSAIGAKLRAKQDAA
jgi:hypothetical protein